ncbi:hypothetical protein SDC9_72841 [bioreactor metagenome]|uniref:Uncharacterized protein n=1 Tax=bioreactor metagenome TaxID=1076179 RepID=A0A644YCW7_9ZZZZ
MALSKEFIDYMAEIEKIDNWEKLPNDDPRIIKLQELGKTSGGAEKERKSGKRVAVFREGKFVRAFSSAAETADVLGMKADAVQAIARGERRPPDGFKIEYIESEVH